MANGNDNHHRLPLVGKVARPQAVTDEGAMTGSFPKYLVLSLRQTDFQTLRAVKIGPLPCGGHAASAVPQGHWLHNPLVSSRCVAGVGGASGAAPRGEGKSCGKKQHRFPLIWRETVLF